MDTKRGQAMMELAVGLFALTLVISALCGFAVYIARSLRAQNELRANGESVNVKSDSVDIGEFAAANFAGTGSLSIREKVEFPERTILK